MTVADEGDDVGDDRAERARECRCAPMTSLLSRVTSAPVWVRVKKAIGIRWTWSNRRMRRSKIRPSPMRDDHQRSKRQVSPAPRAAADHEQGQRW